MSLCVAFTTVVVMMSTATADNFLQPRQLQAQQLDCDEMSYSQCLGNLFNQTDAMRECCQRKVEESWVGVRGRLPWWGWPILAFGGVVLCACFVAASATSAAAAA
eukprot:CAMPEP_0181455434 /NCGR_PEP_ID=MMETSP1110-20121109/30758_1 /TAXON_ID=174948 /ORGANISM="Symbiodinium sp., Strain CCMP421" /LENGTH=104 /DNA_ID=CAMNT_0023579823 /DNA_START=67 /DNA_END=382 /DNA_ORIENTATION=+